MHLARMAGWYMEWEEARRSSFSFIIQPVFTEQGAERVLLALPPPFLTGSLRPALPGGSGSGVLTNTQTAVLLRG